MDTKVGSKVASLILSLVLALGLAGCSGGASSSESSEAFVGVWKLTSMEGEDAADAEDIALMEQLGMFITLTLSEDGDASFDFLGEALEGSWAFKSGKEGTLTMDGETVPIVLEDGKLKMEQDGTAMIFEKADAAEIEKMEEASEESADLDEEADDEVVEEEIVEEDDSADVTEDAEDVHAQVGTEFGNEYATFTITSIEEDWGGDPSYMMEVRNDWDEPIMVTTKYGTFSVNGKMVEPGFTETIQPGKYTEATMWFSSSDVPDVASLVDVEGVIQVLDDDWNTLGEFFVYFPSGE